MFRTFSLLLAFVLFWSVPSKIFAQDFELTWNEAVQEASKNNPEVQAAAQSVRAAQERVKASRSDFFPQITTSTSYNYNGSGLNDPFDVDNDFGNSNNRQQFEIGVGLRQNVFSGLKTVNGVKKAKSQLEDNEANLRLVKSQLNADLKTSFTTLLFFQQQLTVLKKIVDRRSENLRFIELRFEGGSENKGSVLRSQALLEQANFNVARASRALKAAQRNLAKFLGRNYAQNFDKLKVKGTFQTSLPPEPNYAPITENHPDHDRSVAQLKGAKADVKIAQGDLYPAIDASSSVNRRFEVNDDDNNFWSAGLTLNYPFYTGGRDIFETKAARFEEKRFEENLKSKNNTLTSDLKQRYVEFKDAVQNIKIQEGFLKASQVRAEIARNQYANGLISYQDWDQIENDLINDEQAILERRRDAKIAEANWERAQGVGAIP